MRNLAISIIVLFATVGFASTASANCLSNLFSASVKVEDCRQEMQREADAQRARSFAQERASGRYYYQSNFITCGDPRTGSMCGYPNGMPAGREGQWDSYWWGGSTYSYYGSGYHGGRWYRRANVYLYRYGENETVMETPPDPPNNVFVRPDRVWHCNPYERVWKCEVQRMKKGDIFVRNSPRGFPIYVNPPG